MEPLGDHPNGATLFSGFRSRRLCRYYPCRSSVSNPIGLPRDASGIEPDAERMLSNPLPKIPKIMNRFFISFTFLFFQAVAGASQPGESVFPLSAPTKRILDEMLSEYNRHLRQPPAGARQDGTSSSWGSMAIPSLWQDLLVHAVPGFPYRTRLFMRITLHAPE